MTRTNAFLCAGSVASLFAGSAVAHAQEAQPVSPPAAQQVQPGTTGVPGQQVSPASPDQGDIIVTATRRSESLENVPITISQVSAAGLAAAGIADVTQIKIAVPGTTVRQSAGYSLPYIRGVGSAAKTPLNEPPVGTYVDDVYIASQNNILTFNNIASIEVDKGPQGTLFGRNSTGGILNVRTADPTANLTGSVHLGYGSYDLFSGDAYIAGPISDNLRSDLAIVGSHQGEGFGRNLTTGRDVYRNDHNIGVRSKSIFTPTDADRLVLILDYSDQQGSLSSPATLIPGSQVSPGVFAPTISRNPYDVQNDFQPLVATQSGGASLALSHELASGISIKSITAYRRGHNHYFLDVDGTAAPSFGVEGQIDDHQVTQELQVQSAPQGRFTWTAGVFYFDGYSAYDPLTLSFGAVRSRYAEVFNAQSIAGYAQGTFAITPGTHLTLGTRYTSEVRHIDGTITTILPTGVSIVSAPGEVKLRVKADKPSFRASLDHRFSPDILIYASFNSSFKSGGFSAINQPAYLPETLKAYEVGIKSQSLDRRATLNLAGFYYDYRNVQVQQITNTVTLVTNGGKARVYGLDADLSVALTDHLDLKGGLALLSAKYTSFTNAPIGTLQGGAGVFAGSASGNYLPFAPTVSGNAGLVHKAQLAGGALTSSLFLYYSNRYYLQPDNIESQRPYATLNGSIAWQAPGGVSVRVWANNITNKKILENATDAAPAGDFLVSYEPPRTYGITLGYKF